MSVLAAQGQVMGGITYREDFEAWWPDYDHKPEKCFGFVQGSLHDMLPAIAACRSRELCIQAGGHAGFWPRELSKHFKRVITFEPEPDLCECMRRNLKDVPNVQVYQKALGAQVGTVKLRPHVSAGSWRVAEEGTFEVDCTTVDQVVITSQLYNCDALFLDVEGYEPQVLKGAINTIRRFMPVLHVEILPRAELAIKNFMSWNGYRLRQKSGRDAVYVTP